MKRAALLFALLMILGCRADSPSDPSDLRLKGRNMSTRGNFIALAWNKTDKATRTAIIVGGCLFITGAVVLGVRGFIRETKEVLAVKPKQPWETV